VPGVPGYLSIGDFSRATHMTVKTLRHYHQIGFLEPAEVDPYTGYRITAHLGRLEEELGRVQAATASLRDLLAAPAPGDISARIELRSMPAVEAAAITDVVDAEESVAWLQGALGELHATLAARNAPGSGPAGGIADQPKVNT
jgi:hypothetical protein